MDINGLGATAATYTPQPPAARQDARAVSGATPAPNRPPGELNPQAASSFVTSSAAVFDRRYVNDVDPERKREETEARSEQRVEESVEDLNEFVRPYNTSLQFAIEQDSGKVVVKVLDMETREVVKQIPSEEAIELAKALDKLKGLLVHQKA